MTANDYSELWDLLSTAARIAIEDACAPGKRAAARFVRNTRPSTVLDLYRAGLLDNDAEPTDKARALMHHKTVEVFMNDRRLAKLRSTVTYELSWWHRGDSNHRNGIRYYKRQWNRALRRAAREKLRNQDEL